MWGGRSSPPRGGSGGRPPPTWTQVLFQNTENVEPSSNLIVSSNEERPLGCISGTPYFTELSNWNIILGNRKSASGVRFQDMRDVEASSSPPARDARQLLFLGTPYFNEHTYMNHYYRQKESASGRHFQERTIWKSLLSIFREFFILVFQ